MRYLCSILILVLFTKCKSFENLSLSKENYLFTNLKLSGYFYRYNIENEYNAFFIYKNGIYHGGSWLKKIALIKKTYLN